MAILTFIIPVHSNQEGKTIFLMDWDHAVKVPWGILILFGGGFALASGFQSSGLTVWLGSQLSYLHFLPIVLIIIIISFITTFTTELTSNTAMAATLLPVVASLGIAININPIPIRINTIK